MDGSQFDAWTRRGFGAAAGGLAGSLLAMSAIPGAEAKKGKKKKKKCKKLGDTCQPNGGKNKKCCGCLACHPINAVPDSEHHCCNLHGEPCTLENAEEKCCSGQCGGATMSTPGHCICKTNGQGCTESRQCCSGFCDTAGSDQCEPPPPA
jgi:hypothetical protein